MANERLNTIDIGDADVWDGCMKVKPGDLLRGGKRFSQDGIEEWFAFPRFRVVALHMNEEVMFMEALNEKGETLDRIQMMNVSSDQWQHWVDS